MPFVLIRGTYFPAIGEPDGDSVRFAAADISLWDRLDGRVDDPGTNDTLQLRFEGIDALEKTAIQPLATEARDSMLDLVGSSPGKEPSRGYVLSRAAESHGRPIVFAFAGDPPEADGTDVFLDAARLREVTVQVVTTGITPQFVPTARLREAEMEPRSHAGPRHTPR